MVVPNNNSVDEQSFMDAETIQKIHNIELEMKDFSNRLDKCETSVKSVASALEEMNKLFKSIGKRIVYIAISICIFSIKTDSGASYMWTVWTKVFPF